MITIAQKRFEHKITLGKDWRGTLIRKSFYSTKSKADAKRKAEKYRAQYELDLLCGGEAARPRVRFRDWAEVCLEKYKRPFVKGNSYTGTYLHPLRDHLMPTFGDAVLEDILPVHVQDYVNRMIKRYKPETIKKDVAVLAFIMEHAVENGYCKTNPVTKTIQLPRIERAEKRAYTQEEYNKVYEFCKKYPDGLSIMVLMETGISRSELLGLRWDDLDLETGTLFINQGLVSYKDANGQWVTESEGLKNSYRKRAIPIVDPELLRRLRAKPRRISYNPNYTEGHDTVVVDTGYVFHSPTGKPYQPNNWNNRVFLPFMKALHEAYPDIPQLSAHELRHTRATLWIAQGVSAFLTARLLGHSDTKMLMKIYDHTDEGTLRKVLEDAKMQG